MSDEDALRPGERWEWGVKHSQGIRNDGSEARARYSLDEMLRGRRRSRPGVLVPHLVRRRVSHWLPVESPEANQ